VAALGAGLFGLGAWLNLEFGVGEGLVAALKEHTFAARMEHSGESRLRIWDQLERTYARSPLGIGPGNSGSLTLGIAERERPDSYRSKEAHSDYLAYAIERGPLGVLGLLGLTVAGFVYVAGYWRAARRGTGVAPWARRCGPSMAAAPPPRRCTPRSSRSSISATWLFLALVCASALVASGAPRNRSRRPQRDPCAYRRRHQPQLVGRHALRERVLSLRAKGVEPHRLHRRPLREAAARRRHPGRHVPPAPRADPFDWSVTHRTARLPPREARPRAHALLGARHRRAPGGPARRRACRRAHRARLAFHDGSRGMGAALASRSSASPAG
jgi:hypothetical protein